MSDAETLTVTGRYPKGLVGRLDRVVSKRMVNRQVILREALELYLAVAEKDLRIVQHLPGGFEHGSKDKG